VDRSAAHAGGDARLAQDRHGVALAERGFERAHLDVDVFERAQLVEHQLVVALAEPVQVEDESAEVAVCELARLAQETHPPSDAAAGAEARRFGGGSGDLGTFGLGAAGRLRRVA
jgi:hypothetical protein